MAERCETVQLEELQPNVTRSWGDPIHLPLRVSSPFCVQVLFVSLRVFRSYAVCSPETYWVHDGEDRADC